MFKNMSEVKQANKETGHYWFSPDTMRFFKSKVETDLISGCYFVTSEKGPSGPRRYTVRMVNTDSTIDTAGDFQGYATKLQALKAIIHLTAK